MTVKIKKEKPLYMDKSKSIELRVADLLKRMTIEEKVMQLCSIGDWMPDKKISENGKFSFKKARKVLKHGMGQLSCILRHHPPKKGAKLANDIQKFVMKQTRLGIPIIIHDECLHGLMAIQSTSFPQAIALASTWEPELVKQVAETIGKETRNRGIQQCLSPTVNITHDPRCGRTEETYGEDPYLSSRMGVAFVSGLQSQKVVATPKHYVANFVSDGGRDSNAVHISERLLREVYFPAFKACVQEANALSIMVAYNSLDGIPCSANKWLLQDVLREEWGFKGFVVSDYSSVVHMYEKHKTAKNRAEAAKHGTEAGMDVELPSIDCYDKLIDLAKAGRVSMNAINKNVSRVLWVKFWLGLFENPFVDPDSIEKICNCKKHRELALDTARKSIILLRNKKNILPLKKSFKSIAVIGPNAKNMPLGGYSTWDIKVISPLEGIKNRAPKNVKINFAEGCRIADKSKEGFNQAVEASQKSDVVIMCMGNTNQTEGEDRDRCNLNLPGVQEDLILEISKTKKPVIVVLINGSAITMMNWINKVQAVIEAWYPGEEGGNAIADILFGNTNPSGKLPITFPKTTGQVPLYYNYKPSGRQYNYVDLKDKAQYLFPFGFGLSYTKFKYSNLIISPKKVPVNGEVTISVNVKNKGQIKGDEIVQLYIHDEYSSLARPVQELKRFKKITLKPGEMQKIQFTLGEKDLGFLNRHMEFVVEPGAFCVMIGSNSVETLKGRFIVI